MGMNSQGPIDLTVAQNLDKPTSLCRGHKSLRYQVFRLYLAPGIEELEIVDVNDSILITKSSIAIAKASNER
jgi:hypothetical protein